MARDISPHSVRYASASASSRIPLPATSQKNASKSSTSISSSASTKKRAALGERPSENIPELLLSSQPPSKARPAFIVTKIASPTRKAKTMPRPSALGKSVRMAFDPDQSLLLDMEEPDMMPGMTSPITSDAEDAWGVDSSRNLGRSRIGAGRLMTPECSQEAVSQSRKSPLAPRFLHRLPTPPSSQSNDLAGPSSRPLVRPRPAPTPPRKSARDSIATVVQDPSPNPRRKKSPRVQQLSTANSPTRSTPTSSRMRPVPIDESHFQSQAPSLGRSFRAASASTPGPQLAASASTAPSTLKRARQTPSTAKKPLAPATKPRKSRATPVPTKARARQSLKASSRLKSPGPKILPAPPAEEEPGDDPLLLKALDDDEYWEKRLAEARRPKPRKTDVGLRRSVKKDKGKQRAQSIGAADAPLPDVASWYKAPITVASAPVSSQKPDVASDAVDTGADEIDLPIPEDDDIQYDPLPAWASDDDTEIGEGEANHWEAGAVDDTFQAVPAGQADEEVIVTPRKSLGSLSPQITSTTPQGLFPSIPVAVPSPSPTLHEEPSATLSVQIQKAASASKDVEEEQGDITEEAVSGEWDASMEGDSNQPAAPSLAVARDPEPCVGVSHVKPVDSLHEAFDPAVVDISQDSIATEWDNSVEIDVESANLPRSEPPSPREHSPSPSIREMDGVEQGQTETSLIEDRTEDGIAADWEDSVDSVLSLPDASPFRISVVAETAADDESAFCADSEVEFSAKPITSPGLAQTGGPLKQPDEAESRLDMAASSPVAQYETSSEDTSVMPDDRDIRTSSPNLRTAVLGAEPFDFACDPDEGFSDEDCDVTQEAISDEWATSIEQDAEPARSPSPEVLPTAEEHDAAFEHSQSFTNGDVTEEAIQEEWDTSAEHVMPSAASLSLGEPIDEIRAVVENTSISGDLTEEGISAEWEISIDQAHPVLEDEGSPVESGAPRDDHADIDFTRDDSPAPAVGPGLDNGLEADKQELDSPVVEEGPNSRAHSPAPPSPDVMPRSPIRLLAASAVSSGRTRLPSPLKFAPRRERSAFSLNPLAEQSDLPREPEAAQEVFIDVLPVASVPSMLDEAILSTTPPFSPLRPLGYIPQIFLSVEPTVVAPPRSCTPTTPPSQPSTDFIPLHKSPNLSPLSDSAVLQADDTVDEVQEESLELCEDSIIYEEQPDAQDDAEEPSSTRSASQQATVEKEVITTSISAHAWAEQMELVKSILSAPSRFDMFDELAGNNQDDGSFNNEPPAGYRSPSSHHSASLGDITADALLEDWNDDSLISSPARRDPRRPSDFAVTTAISPKTAEDHPAESSATQLVAADEAEHISEDAGEPADGNEPDEPNSAECPSDAQGDDRRTLTVKQPSEKSADTSFAGFNALGLEYDSEEGSDTSRDLVDPELEHAVSGEEGPCRSGKGDHSRTDDDTHQEVDSEELEIPHQSSRILLRVVEKGVVKIEPHPESNEPMSSDDVSESRRLDAEGGRKPLDASPDERPPATENAASGAASMPRSTTPAYSPRVYPSLALLPAVDSGITTAPLPRETCAAPETRNACNPSSFVDVGTELALSVAGDHATQISAGRTSSKQQNEQHSERSVPPRKSLGDELSTATAADFDDTDIDASFMSMVKVSSLDPRAAARAAAILKLNHKYIEHGLPPTSTPSSSSITLPTPGPSRQSLPPTTPDALRKSRGLASVEAARQVTREELLYEAELELVATRRSKSRSRARSLGATEGGYASEDSELPLPGGWKHTPGKRKRPTAVPIVPKPVLQTATHDRDASGKPWGVLDWKKLEKVYRAELQDWIKSREVKPMPTTGVWGWAKKAIGLQAPEVKEWDMNWVVDSFVAQEKCEGLGGEWARDTILLRVKALEKRVHQRVHDKDEAAALHPSKKPRTETTAIAETPHKAATSDTSIVSIVPPTTIRRMIGSLWSSTSKVNNSIVEQAIAEDEHDAWNTTAEIFSEPTVRKVENKLLTRLRAIPESRPAEPTTTQRTDKGKGKEIPETSFEEVPLTPMREVAKGSITAIQSSPLVGPSRIQHPSSPHWAPVLRNNEPLTSTVSSSRPIESVGDSVTPARSLYPALNPPYTQRSSAIKALFETPSAGSGKTAATTVPLKKGSGSPSVVDLVKSFEHDGTLKRSYKKKETEATKR